MSTVMVGVVLPDEQVSVPGAAELEFDLPDPELDGQVASTPTEETTPGVVLLLGRVMVTVSPTATSVCCEAPNATCTIRVVEVACITAWRRGSMPCWVTPRAAWSFTRAVKVAHPKAAEVGLS